MVSKLTSISAKHIVIGANAHASLTEALHGARPDLAIRGNKYTELTADDLAWGDTYVAGSCNCKGTDDKFTTTAPVGSFKDDHCGPFFDMAGNVSEWCVESSGKGALRGGSWNLTPASCKLSGRNTAPVFALQEIHLHVHGKQRMTRGLNGSATA